MKAQYGRLFYVCHFDGRRTEKSDSTGIQCANKKIFRHHCVPLNMTVSNCHSDNFVISIVLKIVSRSTSKYLLQDAECFLKVYRKSRKQRGLENEKLFETDLVRRLSSFLQLFISVGF